MMVGENDIVKYNPLNKHIMKYKYAIQLKSTGQVIDYCDAPAQAE